MLPGVDLNAMSPWIEFDFESFAMMIHSFLQKKIDIRATRHPHRVPRPRRIRCLRRNPHFAFLFPMNIGDCRVARAHFHCFYIILQWQSEFERQALPKENLPCCSQPSFSFPRWLLSCCETTRRGETLTATWNLIERRRPKDLYLYHH